MADQIDWRRAAEYLAQLASQQKPRLEVGAEGALDWPRRESPQLRGTLTLPQPGGNQFGVSGSLRSDPKGPDFSVMGRFTRPF